MSTLTRNDYSESRFTSGFGGFTQFLGEVFAGIRQGREMADRYDYLSRLPDSELTKRGFRREDLPQIALRGL